MGEHPDRPALSEPERKFNRRWRELEDAAGGQAKVARLLECSTSTVSRIHLGWTLPGDGRARLLCRHLKLGREQEEALLTLLEHARPAHYARRRDRAPGTPADVAAAQDADEAAGGDSDAGPATGLVPEAGDPGRESRPGRAPGERTRPPGRRVALASAVVALGVIAAVLVVVFSWRGRAPEAELRASGAPVARGSYRGLPVKAIPIRESQLTPAVASTLRHGEPTGPVSVNGFAFRNIKNPGLCLTAGDTGSRSGQNGDRVDVEACDYAPNQVWIPVQWEAAGRPFTQLVSYRYQSKCLNAQNIGGLANGHRTQLWNCYQSPNEYWDFGDWYQSVKGQSRAYPIFIQSVPMCLDADKNDFGDGGAGAQVNIWNQYQAANQFWS